MFRFSLSVFFTVLIVLCQSCGVKKSLNNRPDLTSYTQEIPSRTQIDSNTYLIGKNYLTKNKYGLWELYVEGDALERGLLIGSLTRELYHYQEDVFLAKVEDFVPSKTKQYFLKKFLAWYNRKMYKYVKEEYKAEIYGLSRYASSKYNHIAPPYLRVLYLHGAHDIGHALQDLALVGCSSFASWDEKTSDGKLLLARNFDFYVNDRFSKEKILSTRQKF